MQYRKAEKQAKRQRVTYKANVISRKATNVAVLTIRISYIDQQSDVSTVH